jgi:hypothetical protein
MPVPAEVTAAAIMQGETAPHAGGRSAEMDSTCSAGATETQSADASRTCSAHMRCTESTQAADVAAAEPAGVAAAKSSGVAAAKSAAAMAAASSTASTRLCRGCNGTGERAGDENDHHLLQHLPIPLLGCRLHACGCVSSSDALQLPAVLCPCRALLTVAAISTGLLPGS